MKQHLNDDLPTTDRKEHDGLHVAFDNSPILFEQTSDINAFNDPNRVAISGIGLSWSKYNNDNGTLESGLTTGLPIDIMSYLSAIGQRHKHLPNAPKTIFLVSDYFAQGLPGITDDALRETTDSQIDKLTKIAAKLKIKGTDKTLLDCLDIRRVSQDISQNQESFDNHYNNLAHHENDYERRQTAAIAMYRETTDATVKISYAFEDAAKPSGKKDERSFDQLSGDYKTTKTMSFVYVDIGRATDTSNAKACPYITNKVLQQKRLMMGDTDFAEKIRHCEEHASNKTGRSGTTARKRLRDIQDYMSNLAQLIDDTFTTVDGNEIIELNTGTTFESHVKALEKTSKLAL